MKRHENTHLINFSSSSHDTIKYFTQFKIDSNIKDRMLKSYQSINQEEHQRYYASWDSGVEGIYFTDDNGISIFKEIFNNLDRPAGTDLF